MTTSRQYRDRAATYRGLFEESTGLEKQSEFKELEQSFTTLANNEEWLERNHDNIIHAPESSAPDAAAGNEDRMLRYLGAALIMQWNTLPVKLQRELFDSASAMDDILDRAESRGQIARFLHIHKDDGEAKK